LFYYALRNVSTFPLVDIFMCNVDVEAFADYTVKWTQIDAKGITCFSILNRPLCISPIGFTFIGRNNSNGKTTICWNQSAGLTPLDVVPTIRQMGDTDCFFIFGGLNHWETDEGLLNDLHCFDISTKLLK
jgi:hypothetical protein